MAYRSLARSSIVLVVATNVPWEGELERDTALTDLYMAAVGSPWVCLSSRTSLFLGDVHLQSRICGSANFETIYTLMAPFLASGYGHDECGVALS